MGEEIARAFYPEYTACEGRAEGQPPLGERWHLLAHELATWLHERRCTEIDILHRDLAAATTAEEKKTMLGQMLRRLAMAEAWSLEVGLLSPLERMLDLSVAGRLGIKAPRRRTPQGIAQDNARHILHLYWMAARLCLNLWADDWADGMVGLVERTRMHQLMLRMQRLAADPNVQQLQLTEVMAEAAEQLRLRLLSDLPAGPGKLLEGWRHKLKPDKPMEEEGAGGARVAQGSIEDWEEQFKQLARQPVPWEQPTPDEHALLVGDETYPV